MSAECGTCGSDLSYGPGEYPDMFCDRCDLQAEVERLRSGQWTDEERKLFLFEATKASYAEGTRAGCEELSIAAAEMSVELEEAQAEVERLRTTLDAVQDHETKAWERARRIEEAARTGKPYCTRYGVFLPRGEFANGYTAHNECPPDRHVLVLLDTAALRAALGEKP